MATSFSQSETRENGVIILGNAGAGKSHICNILVGYNRFEAEFQPEAVTTATEHDRVTLGSNSFRIYNIPGLVEVNQEHIDRNKREIMKAFDQSPTSIVLFVWTQIGGRAQNDDVIAFNALNNAYKFPTGSLMFIVNNIPTKRPPDYEGKFITTLSTMLKPMPVSLKDTFFLDTMDSEDKQKISEARSRLILFINHHHASLQRRHADIMLQSDQLNKMRELLKKQQVEAERNREAFQNQIQKMTKEYQIAKEEEKKRYQLMQDKFETLRIQAEKDRAAQAEERRYWDKQQQKQNELYQQQLAAQAEERRYWEKQQREQQKQNKSRRDDPLRVVSDVVAAPITTVEGTVRGTAAGYNAMVGPVADYIDNSDNNILLRAAAVPVGVVGGVVGGAVGAVAGTLGGAIDGLGRIFSRK